MFSIDSILEGKVYSIVNETSNDIEYDIDTCINTIILIDFYNIYCSYVKFNKYKSFSEKTFSYCLTNIIYNKFKNHKKVIIVAKEVYESFGTRIIESFVKKYSNFEYHIIYDNSGFSGNRERDDYYILSLSQKFNLSGFKSVILTNDLYRNYKAIINKTRNYTIHLYIDNRYIVENIEIKENERINLMDYIIQNGILTVKYKLHQI